MIPAIRTMMSKVFPQNHFPISEHLKENPMVGYLNLYKSQHRMIFVLYCSLILSFMAFLLLISVFTFYTFSSKYLVPTWGTGVLVFIDLLLLGGTIQGIRQLFSYRYKSQKILDQIYESLETDLFYIQKIKSMGYKSKQPLIIKNYGGWDSQTCPECNARIEMLQSECANCHYPVKDFLPC